MKQREVQLITATELSGKNKKAGLDGDLYSANAEEVPLCCSVFMISLSS
ncbi:hypothetical protein [Echinicola pacifica]|nr:hypothetical protein [Echinicola pacifica]